MKTTATGGNFGVSTAISADGNTAVIGASHGNNGLGAAYVYNILGTSLINALQLPAPPTSGANASIGTAILLGQSVAISADGKTIMVGAPTDNTTIGSIGAAWIYQYNGSSWLVQQKLIGTTGVGPGPREGNSVALSADGNTAMIGGPYNNGHQGGSWLFARDNYGNWSTGGVKLLAVDKLYGSTDYRQGNGVALSADGTTAIIGGPEDGDIGSAWAFTFGQPRITGISPSSGPAGTLLTISGFGLQLNSQITIAGIPAIPVSISPDATTLIAFVMPAPVGTSGPVAVGTLKSSNNFTINNSVPPEAQQGNKLRDNSQNYSNQGNSLAVSADGKTILVGDYLFNNNDGKSWLYKFNNGAWQTSTVLIPSGLTLNMTKFGTSLALSSDGNTAIIGAPFDNTGLGAAWVYSALETKWTKILPGNDATAGAIDFGSGVALSADGKTALIGGDNDNSGTGAAWIFQLMNGVWTQIGTKLVAGINKEIGKAKLGNKVALSADGKTALVGGPNDNGGSGAVWVFISDPLNGNQWSEKSKLVASGYTNPVGTAPGLSSIAINADGSIAIVGGPYDDPLVYNNTTSLGDYRGGAWIFKRNADQTWSQEGGKLLGSNTSEYANQGWSVGISADGNLALVGAPSYDGLGDKIGGAWVFTRSVVGGVPSWGIQGSKRIGDKNLSNTYPQWQGYSVALSSDGNTAVLGGPQDNFNGHTLGAAWVFWGTPGTVRINSINAPFAISKDSSEAVAQEEVANDGKGFAIYPNPVAGSPIQIVAQGEALGSDPSCEISLVSTSGKEVYAGSGPLSALLPQLQASMDQSAAGVYVLRISSGTVHQTVKLSKL